MNRPTALAIAATALVGCRHSHRDANAPGHIDVRRPPAAASRALETPGDPGERIVALSPGVIVAGGPTSIDGAARAVFDGALEVTVDVGDSDTSHNDHGFSNVLFMPRGLILPREGIGVTLGWSALRLSDRGIGRDDDGDGVEDHEVDLTTGPLYAEVHRAEVVGGAGAGWSYDPATGDHGPELFAYLAVLHLRARWMVGDGAELLLGIQVKLPHSWVTSR